MEHKENKYQAFWDWFNKYKNLLEETTLSHPIIGGIDKQLSILGNFAWEIGPGVHKPFSFTISPKGDSKLIQITKEIISYAPNVKGWEFYFAKPAKEMKEFNFLLGGKKIHVDISGWEYVLFEYDDGKFGLDISPTPYFDYYTDDQYGIVDMTLCNLIGEENKIQKVAEYAVVEKFDSNVLKNRSLLTNLPSQLKKMSSR